MVGGVEKMGVKVREKMGGEGVRGGKVVMGWRDEVGGDWGGMVMGRVEVEVRGVDGLNGVGVDGLEVRGEGGVGGDVEGVVVGGKEVGGVGVGEVGGRWGGGVGGDELVEGWGGGRCGEGGLVVRVEEGVMGDVRLGGGEGEVEGGELRGWELLERRESTGVVEGGGRCGGEVRGEGWGVGVRGEMEGGKGDVWEKEV